ncbi:hypothetical protein [Actinosynnema sp. NPDC023587]|uniref:hypothetical protein n=1 Tax=Actinosynnema sp. NPDC023587 TaxID=3154695 RepID=UPI0033F74BAE
MTPDALIGLLADPVRPRVASASGPGARSPGETAEKAGVDVHRVASRGPRGAGPVVGPRGGMVVRQELVDRPARVECPPPGPFAGDGRLLRPPGRRRAVRGLVCTAFEPGRGYPGRAVDEGLPGRRPVAARRRPGRGVETRSGRGVDAARC